MLPYSQKLDTPGGFYAGEGLCFVLPIRKMSSTGVMELRHQYFLPQIAKTASFLFKDSKSSDVNGGQFRAQERLGRSVIFKIGH